MHQTKWEYKIYFLTLHILGQSRQNTQITNLKIILIMTYRNSKCSIFSARFLRIWFHALKKTLVIKFLIYSIIKAHTIIFIDYQIFFYLVKFTSLCILAQKTARYYTHQNNNYKTSWIYHIQLEVHIITGQKVSSDN